MHAFNSRGFALQGLDDAAYRWMWVTVVAGTIREVSRDGYGRAARR